MKVEFSLSICLIFIFSFLCFSIFSPIFSHHSSPPVGRLLRGLSDQNDLASPLSLFLSIVFNLFCADWICSGCFSVKTAGVAVVCGLAPFCPAGLMKSEAQVCLLAPWGPMQPVYTFSIQQPGLLHFKYFSLNDLRSLSLFLFISHTDTHTIRLVLMCVCVCVCTSILCILWRFKRAALSEADCPLQG